MGRRTDGAPASPGVISGGPPVAAAPAAQDAPGMSTNSTTPPSDASAPGPVRLNPGGWASGFRYDQAQLRPAPTRILTIAGQGAIDPDGTLHHPGDLAAQFPVAVANVEELLALGEMTLRDVLRLVVYVTDVDAALGAYGALVERLDAAGATPPATLVGVARLALPGMAVEIEATAGR